MTPADAWALLRQRRGPEAVAGFRQALAADPADAAAMRGLALALAATGVLEEALGWIERATAGPAAPPAWRLDRARLLLRVGRREEAVAAALALRADVPPAILGDVLMTARAYGDAVAAYRTALDDAPTAAVWNNLGGALRELGRIDEAVDAHDRAVALDPGRYEAWANLAVARERAGDAAGAIPAWERAAALRPADLAPVRALARLLRGAGRASDALAAYERWAALAPGEAAAHHGRGIVLDEVGRLEEGIAALERAGRLAPENADLHYDLGRALRRAGRDQAAIAAFRAAVRLVPDHGEALSALGSALWQANESAMALEAFRRAAAARPDHPEVLSRHANALQAFGRQDESRAVFERALERHPGDWSLRYQACIARLPIVYRDEAERVAARRDYAAALTALAAEPMPGDRAELRRRAEALHVRQPFYLAYQGENDRALQAAFGGMACRVMAAWLPEFAAAPPAPGLAPGQRIRVGVLTAFFRHHSVWKVPLHSWLTDLDRDRFAIHGYFPGEGDRETAVAERLCDTFVAGRWPVERWARRIRSDRLHVLLIPEIGMDATTMQLAALRLAPVQATSWGHPQTSGMPTVDAFLSSALMEPEDGGDHYTERLVRLPGLSFRRSVPPVRPEGLGRGDIGIEEDAVLYWCCQSLYKYLPADDGVLPRIAAAVPQARFVFVGYPMGDAVGGVVRARLGAAFAAAGLDAERHCRFLGSLPAARFAAVGRLADVFLDSIGWSGCNSALESLDGDLPLVTWPGRAMRARHSLAILRLMGIEDTVAASADEYVAIAVRLGRDAAWRRSLRDRIAGARGILATDRSWLPALETFLAEAARGWRRDPVGG